ncbi:TIGR03790 family protein [Burkholderiaceae bacterium UC74_6]
MKRLEEGGFHRLVLRIVQCLSVSLCLAALPLSAAAQEGSPQQTAQPAAAATAPPAPVLRMQRLQGHITAQTLGLVINLDDPYSVAVGEYYQQKRGIPAENIVHVHLAVKPRLSVAEFAVLEAQVRKQMPEAVQGLALAWRQPYAVECNGLTSALARGYQPKICEQTCAASEVSPYVQYTGNRPFAEKGIRPTMMLAARSVESARRLIDRGVSADGTLPSAFLGANAWFITTSDAVRSVRSAQFPPAGMIRPWGVDVKRIQADALPQLPRTLILQTGLVRVEGLDKVGWLPGALADHLTSFGGALDAPPGEGQMSAIEWIEAGATASYGTVSEPCNHWQKFPHSQLLLLSYVQGVTALEAYWHSVAWPAQGVFIGEPLAAPFASAF